MPLDTLNVSPTIGEVTNQFDRVASEIEAARRRDGSLDTEKLDRRALRKNDVALSRAVGVINDHFVFERKEAWLFKGHLFTIDAERPKKTINETEVRGVLNALVEARKQVSDLDRDGDGRISKDETSTTLNPGMTVALLNEIAAGEASMVAAQMHYFKAGLNICSYGPREFKWWIDNGSLTWQTGALKNRSRFEHKARKVAAQYAKTELGAEALAWAYRDLIVHDPKQTGYEKTPATSAKKAFLRELPLFRRVTRFNGIPLNKSFSDFIDERAKRQHTDEEIKAALGVDDLRKYCEQTRASIANRIGGDYFDHYLAAKDVE